MPAYPCLPFGMPPIRVPETQSLAIGLRRTPFGRSIARAADMPQRHGGKHRENGD